MAQPAAHGEESANRDAAHAAPAAAAAAPSAGTAIALPNEPRRYRDIKASRPPPLRIRSWRAYWVTFLVIGSYLVLRLRARFHDNHWVEHALRATHLRNARRIEHTICGLQGLFIKV